jgi:lysozyme
MAKRKNKTIRNRLLLAVIVFIGTLAYVSIAYLRKQFEIEEAKRVRYEAFGIEIPDGYRIHGIDVSNHQQFIDWSSVAEMQIDSIRLGFAFMKATEGTDFTDKRFKRNWEQSKEAGVIRGAYHFFLANKSGRTQAKFFMKTVPIAVGDLPPVVDVEKLNGTKSAVMIRELKIFLNELEMYYRVKPIIYTYLNFYERYLGDAFKEYPLWIAHYLQPTKPRIEREWTFWQHSESGRVNGIRTKVDFNVFYDDSTSFQNLLIK